MRFTVAVVLFFLFLNAFSCGEEDPTITVRVVIPPSTPSDAQIFISGNGSPLGDWDPGKVVMKKENDSLWSFVSVAPRGYLVEFKITRGSWNTQAIYEKGVIPGNHKVKAFSDTIVIVRPLSWSDQESIGRAGSIVGTVKYHKDLAGKGLNHRRDVVVWLPPSYDSELAKRYPVLYMHDGQNVFDPATSFIGFDWRADDVADSLIRAGAMQEIVIVGINNSPDRGREYSDNPLGRAYARFVIDVVKPMIDSSYRTLPDRKNTAVMGSSMGGLISFLFVWWHPDVFYQAGCLSSAFLVEENKILKEVSRYGGAKKAIRVYLDDGSEGLDEQLKPGYDEMVRLLEEKGYRKGIDLEYFFDEGAEHNEPAWANRLWRPLIFMYGKPGR
jgi:predicted alpha/beta superfamily hydrolase